MPTPTIVLFEELRPSHRWLVRWYLGRGHKVLYRHLHVTARDSPWVQAAISQGLVAPLVLDPPPIRWQEPSCDQALACVDAVYAANFARSGMIRAVERLYGNEDMAKAFKKALVQEMTDPLYFRLLMKRALDAFPGHRAYFVPADGALPRQYRRVERWLHRCGDPLGPRGAWKFAGKFAARSRRRTRDILHPDTRHEFLRLRALAVLGRSLARLLKRSWRARGDVPVPVEYDLGITIVSPPRQFSEGVRRFDFLLDGQKVTKERTLIVPLVELLPARLDELAKQNFRVPARFEPASWEDVRANARAAVAIALLWASTPTWLTTCAVQLVKTHGVWSGFLRYHHPKTFITYNDFGVGHIGRNLLLRKAGVATWYYLTSANVGCAYARKDLYAFPYWAFLSYDKIIVWNSWIKVFYERHRQDVGEYVVGGCLWSEDIRRLHEGSLRSTVPARLTAAGVPPGSKIVSVFDSWYHPDSINKREDILAFALDLEHLLESMPEVHMVFKAKLPRDAFDDDVYLDGRKIFETYERLAKHPRCHFFQAGAPTSELCAASDLVISFPFTSVSYEALAAGLKALYYDATEKMRGTPYDSIPGFVLHGRAELERGVFDLLYKTSDEDFRRHLETHVGGKGEPFLDGHALTRLRRMVADRIDDDNLL